MLSKTKVDGARSVGQAKNIDIESVIEPIIESIGAAWPELAVSGPEFLHHVAESDLLADQDAQSATEIRWPELYLAWACATGCDSAIEAFERRYFGQVDAVGSRHAKLCSRDEFRQYMREKLFVLRKGGAVTIASYRGRGGLATWVRIVATRAAIDLQRRRRDALASSPSDDGLLEQLVVDSDSPEYALLKRQYRQQFKQAFALAMDSLTIRQRNLLRQRYVYRLQVQEIADLYQLHRVSASRALARACSALATAIESALREQLDDSDVDVEGIARMVASQIELSLERLLQDQPG